MANNIRKTGKKFSRRKVRIKENRKGEEKGEGGRVGEEDGRRHNVKRSFSSEPGQ